jgi:hypothetical protein
MGIARLLPFVLLLSLVPVLAHGKEAAAFKRTVAGAEVDWSAGTITAQAGAAADIRMPGPNTARPGAERRARAAAEEKLGAALAILVRGKTSGEKDVLKRATVSRTEYQSDGGVVLWLTLRFADVAPAKAAPITLKVATTSFEFAPVVIVSDREVPLAFATYRSAADVPRDAIRVERDGKGHLVVPPGAAGVESLAGASVVIYLEKAP